MIARRADRGAPGLMVLATALLCGWTMCSRAFQESKRLPWQSTRLEDRLNGNPTFAPTLRDRHGHTLARSAWYRSQGGRMLPYIERPYGTALAAAGVGRHVIADTGVHGNLSDGIRRGFDGLRPFDEPGWIVRAFLGDAELAAGDVEDLTLTLDAGLSARIYQLVRAHASDASVVALSARTGEIWAAVDAPGPDVNLDALPVGASRLWSLMSANLPASTMKALTGAFMLQTAAGNPRARHFCSGSRCWTAHGGVSGLADAIARSCNTWFRLEAPVLSAPAWRQFLLAIGIAPIGIAGLPDGALVVANQRGERLHWPHAVGQQTWVSLVGLASAYATVTSSDGELRVPRVVRDVRPGHHRASVVRSDVTRAVREMLRRTATTGTARVLNTIYKGRDAGGKTGTGERDNAASDAVFVAVAPWNDPRWVVTVSIRGGRSGGNAAQLAGRVLNLLPRDQ